MSSPKTAPVHPRLHMRSPSHVSMPPPPLLCSGVVVDDCTHALKTDCRISWPPLPKAPSPPLALRVMGGGSPLNGLSGRGEGVERYIKAKIRQEGLEERVQKGLI